ncbi:hypothetical protein IAU60_002214 [Kwoniella sp. DSM 27419]
MLFPTKLAAVSTLVAVANALTVSTPASLIECQPVQLTWTGGAQAPYYISVIPGGQAGATALENLPEAQSSPTTWNVDLAAGTNVTISIRDGSGTVAYSSPVVIQSGSSTSCLGTNSGSSSAAASGSAAASSGSAAASSGGASATASQSGSATKAAGASASASASGKSGASSTVQSAGAVVVLGAVAVVLSVLA